MNIEKRIWWLSIFCFFCVVARAQETKLEPNKSVEREIVGGESHSYQITLQTGQFARFRLMQRAIDTVIILTSPDGKQLRETNLTRAGDEESLSVEAPLSGDYRLTLTGKGRAELRGAYQLTTVVNATVSASDKQRILAETLMQETEKLVPQAGKAAANVIENMQRTITIWREQNEPNWEAWSLLRMGRAHYDLSQHTQAIESYKQALSRYQAARNRSGEGETCLRLGVAYTGTNKFDQALEEHQKALAISREVKSRALEAGVLTQIGQTYTYRGEFAKALEYYQPAITLVRETKEQRNEAVLLFSLGNAYLGLSQFEQALESFEQARGISREMQDRSYEAAALANLGAVYGNTSRTEKSIEYIEQALAIFREFKNRPSELSMLINLGNSYLVLGQNEKAVEYFEQALLPARAIKNRLLEGRALQQMGTAYINQRKFEKAIEYIESALAAFQEIKARSWESFTLRSLAVTYYETQQYERAIAVQQQAMSLSREINDQSGTVTSLYQIARAQNHLGTFTQAQATAEEGIRIAELLRDQLGSGEFRAALLASETVQGAYRLYLDLLMRRHRMEPEKDWNALALEASERLRARSLLDLLTQSRVNLRQGVDAALIEREHLLAQQLNSKAQQLAQANKAEQIATLRQEVSQLENDLERAQTALRKASPTYAGLTQPQPLKLKELQAQLDPDTLLLEYSLGAERSYLWAVTKDTLTSYELPKGEIIEKNTRQVYDVLTAPSTVRRGETLSQRRQRIAEANIKFPQLAQELSQIILAPVAQQLGNKRLVIVADGALQYIPFAALPEPVAGGRGSGVGEKQNQPPVTSRQPLIVKHEIVSLPSASTLFIQRKDISTRTPAPKMLAVIADPVFDRSDMRLNNNAMASNDQTPTQTRSFDELRGIVHLAETTDDKTNGAVRKLVIPRLPYTRQEATQLLTFTPQNKSYSALDFQANRTNIINGELGQYRYVHFATHGVLDSERPGLSALLLSMVDEQGKPQDGFLRANDIYNLKLPAELVVLSACQTGLGKEIKGEGLIGLTRGFMYAGAARIVVSLWNVNDQATAELMTKFYQKMLKQGERPAAALRSAQVEMWKQKQWNAPFYWAAFTLQGEWK